MGATFVSNPTEYTVNVYQDGQEFLYKIIYCTVREMWFIKKLSLPGQCKMTSILVGGRVFMKMNARNFKRARTFTTASGARIFLTEKVHCDESL